MSLSFPGASAGRAPAAAPGVTALPFTVAGWVRPGSFASVGYCFYLGTGAAGNAHNYAVNVMSDGTARAVSRGATGTSSVAISGNSTTLNQWAHIVAIFAGNANRRVILDGNTAQATTNTGSVTVNTPTLMVVGNEVNGGSYGAGINGQLENWAVWSAALTDAEAVQLAAGVQACNIRPLNLAHWWPQLPLARDVVGTGHLTLEGTSESTSAPVQRGRRVRLKHAERPAAVVVGGGGMRVAVFI